MDELRWEERRGKGTNITNANEIMIGGLSAMVAAVTLLYLGLLREIPQNATRIFFFDCDRAHQRLLSALNEWTLRQQKPHAFTAKMYDASARI